MSRRACWTWGADVPNLHAPYGTSGGEHAPYLSALLAAGSVTAEALAANSVTSAAILNGTVTRADLEAILGKQIPVEHGRSAEMVSGKITIAAPGVTATGAIVLSLEGATITSAATVVERTVGVSFKVESLATSSDRVNWVLYSE